jgi:hypothetical protein
MTASLLAKINQPLSLKTALIKILRAAAKGITVLLHFSKPMQFDLVNHGRQDHQLNFWSDSPVQAVTDHSSELEATEESVRS